MEHTNIRMWQTIELRTVENLVLLYLVSVPELVLNGGHGFSHVPDQLLLELSDGRTDPKEKKRE